MNTGPHSFLWEKLSGAWSQEGSSATYKITKMIRGWSALLLLCTAHTAGALETYGSQAQEKAIKCLTFTCQMTNFLFGELSLSDCGQSRYSHYRLFRYVHISYDFNQIKKKKHLFGKTRKLLRWIQYYPSLPFCFISKCITSIRYINFLWPFSERSLGIISHLNLFMHQENIFKLLWGKKACKCLKQQFHDSCASCCRKL